LIPQNGKEGQFKKKQRMYKKPIGSAWTVGNTLDGKCLVKLFATVAPLQMASSIGLAKPAF
jgi:hypothetical protein